MAATAPSAWVTAAILASGLTLALACSSVPDVHFVDGGDGTSTSSSGDSGRTDSGGDGGGSSGIPDWSCPNKAPPAGSGSVCCGNRLCVKCSEADCAKCEQAGCTGTLNSVCCPKNPVQITCKAYSDC